MRVSGFAAKGVFAQYFTLKSTQADTEPSRLATFSPYSEKLKLWCPLRVKIIGSWLLVDIEATFGVSSKKMLLEVNGDVQPPPEWLRVKTSGEHSGLLVNQEAMVE